MKKNVLLLIGALLIIDLAVTGWAFRYELGIAERPASDEPEVHLHADFRLFINGDPFDFSGEQFMEESTLYHAIHLHSGDGEMWHIEEPDVRPSQFFDSVGMTLTDRCLIDAAGVQYCTDEQNELKFFVNGQRYPSPRDYLIQDLDRLLISFGPRDDPKIPEQLSQVNDRACIESGSCPERGTPTSENCTATNPCTLED